MGPLHKGLFSLFKMEKKSGRCGEQWNTKWLRIIKHFFLNQIISTTTYANRRLQTGTVAELLNCYGNSHILITMKKREAIVTYILLSIQRILQVELQKNHQYQSESDGERIDRALAGLLEKAKGSFSFSLLSCLCLCLCLCLCFFFFFLCSWWWWWWWSLCFEEFDSLLNTESGAAETGCMFISPEDCSLPKKTDREYCFQT